jgi:hypothetical protein
MRLALQTLLTILTRITLLTLLTLLTLIIQITLTILEPYSSLTRKGGRKSTSRARGDKGSLAGTGGTRGN